MDQHAHTRVHPPSEPESLDQLRGDCARMAPHWIADRAGGFPLSSPAQDAPRVTRYPRGVRVPSRSVRLLDGMPGYGD